PPCTGAATDTRDGAARRPWWLHGRAREPRRRADGGSGAHAAVRRAVRLWRLRAARVADYAATRLYRDVERDRDAGRAGRALSHPPAAARALSAVTARHPARPLDRMRRPGAGRGVRPSDGRRDAITNRAEFSASLMSNN